MLNIVIKIKKYLDNNNISVEEFVSDSSTENQDQIQVSKRMTETLNSNNLEIKHPKSRFARLTSFEVAMNKIKINQQKIDESSFAVLMKPRVHRLSK